MCFPYMYSNVELFRKKRKIQHCNLFLLLLTIYCFYLKNLKQEAFFMYSGRDTYDLLSLSVMFEVLTAESVKRAV